jgi:restriction system protein
MKLKMAPNSLFAVLLRSSWWISVAIFLLFVAASYAWLPVEYRLAGALGGAPFAVIGVIAAWRQARLPSAKRSQELLGAVSAMAWPQFSGLLEEAFTRQGYSVERRDGAADFALLRQGRTTLVSARRWKAARLGEESLQALHRAASGSDAQCLYIALGELSANARGFVKRNNVTLMQGPALVNLLRDAKVPVQRG